MDQQILQCYASQPMEEHFAKNFRKRWNLSHYSNPNAPTLFLGWYESKDWKVIKNHKSPFIFMFGGADFSPQKLNALKSLPNLLGSPGYRPPMLQSFQKVNYPFRKMVIPFKSYDNFKPTPLGNKIYVYQGWKFSRSRYFKWEKFIQPLINEWGEDNFIFGMGHDIDYVHENFYKNSFVYIKPNERGGSTGMWELGHMGRKTIAQNQGGLPNVLEFTDIKHIAELVNQEAKKIGTIQTELATEVKEYLVSNNDWLNINFWK